MCGEEGSWESEAGPAQSHGEPSYLFSAIISQRGFLKKSLPEQSMHKT